MNTVLALTAATKKVEPDAVLLGFMVLFFSYVAWLLWRASDEQR